MQISHICKQVPNVEWSGVLFYKTEGSFGTPDFKCRAEELYLMDIGTAGYTEYEYGPDIVKHMMENKHLLGLTKGHIHSHNSMSVFFSGTDTDELETNSEFHNIYLSLIVNNYNDMVAKIAFRAVRKTSLLEYRNEKGEPAQEVVPDGETYIFVYDCDITLPGNVPVDDVNGRIQEIKARKSPGGTSDSGFFRTSSETKKSKTPKGSEVERGMYSYIRHLLSGEINCGRTIIDLLTDYEAKTKKEKEVVKDRIRKRSAEAYRFWFDGDPGMRRYKNACETASRILRDNYHSFHADVTEDLGDCFLDLANYDYQDSEV